MDLWDDSNCPYTFASRYYPFTPLCMRGCSDLSERTGSNLNPSCPAESSSGVASSSVVENNILSALSIYTEADGCSCSDADGSCIRSDSGFYVSVTNSTDVLSSDSALLTIHGANFAERESDNEVSLTSSVGGTVSARVLTSDEESIILQFDRLSQLNDLSTLSAVVTSTISSSGTSSGSAVPVAKVVAAMPSVASSTDVLSSDSAKLTIQGAGFDALDSSQNVVGMGGTIRAQTAASTISSLTMSFTHLSPSDSGNVLGSVTVQSTWSTSSSSSVATVVAAMPSVASSTDVLNSDSAMLTIQGTGFDALRTSGNSVTLLSSGSDSPSGACTRSTMTSLVVTFTHLSPSESSIDLSGQVVILNTWSSSSVIVAKVLDASGGSYTTDTVDATTDTVDATTDTVDATTDTVDATTDTVDTQTTEQIDVTTASSDVTTVSSDDSEDESSSSSNDTTVIAVSAAIGGVVAILLIVAIYYYSCGGTAIKASGQVGSTDPRHALDNTSRNTREAEDLHEL